MPNSPKSDLTNSPLSLRSRYNTGMPRCSCDQSNPWHRAGPVMLDLNPSEYSTGGACKWPYTSLPIALPVATVANFDYQLASYVVAFAPQSSP